MLYSKDQTTLCTRQGRLYAMLALTLTLSICPARARAQATVRGTVTDSLGAAVLDARVTLLRDASVAGATKTDREGAFEFVPSGTGQYWVRVEAEGFSPQETAPVFLPGGGTIPLHVVLKIGPLREYIVVSATGTELPQSQVGASVNVIDRPQLDAASKLDVFEPLRQVPGVQVVQVGQRGAQTTVFVRGGNQNFNKILLDGIPANNIGGEFAFSNLSTTGVDHVEVLREPNSVLYGSDALTSVINVTTPRGVSTIPEFTYSFDGGNFRTLRQEGSLSGAWRRFDYFSDFSRFDTRNGLPNDSFYNGTFAGNFGWVKSPSTNFRLTARHTAVALGLPNALDFFGIPDDSSQSEHDTAFGLTAQNQTTSHWHNLARLSWSQLRSHFVNPSPSGTPFGGNYVGNTVTIQGANGFSATGRAILDFGGVYPQLFDSKTKRRSVYAQSDYLFNSGLRASFGFRYENERGFTQSGGKQKSFVGRNNFSTFLEGHGSLRHRAYATVGVGFEQNEVFGFAATPRVSLAYYLRRPSASATLGGTKLKLNFGTGIKEPSVLNEGSSLFSLLSKLPQGPALISQFSISPIGPERSRSFALGVEQGLWGERARLGITLFHNRFFDLIEFVRKGALPRLGVPPDVAAATAFGAAINSQSFRARGAEVEFQVSPIRSLNIQAEYTYLDAAVTRSFSSDALGPAVNPAFPNIPIGGFSPLIGSRPFRRAPHSGGLTLRYSRRKVGLLLAGSFVGRRDDSTFLEFGDAFFGNSLLLPNRNLDAGYQKIDWSGRYELTSSVSLYASVENVLNQHYRAAFGYPALPLTFRSGVKITLGGEARRRP